MADKTIAVLDTMTLADLLEAAVFEAQNVGGTAPESRRIPSPALQGVAGG